MSYIYHESNLVDSMTQAEMQNNANEIYSQLSSYGWSLEAICGVLGNMQYESYINPAQWQIGFNIGSANAGFGLVQWTPSTKYINWATGRDYNKNEGYWQVYNLDTQSSGIEYIKTDAYPLTYAQFKVSTNTPSYLCEVFLKNYERAGVEQLAIRQRYANEWYEYLGGITPPVPPIPPTTRTKMPLWFYTLRKE